MTFQASTGVPVEIDGGIVVSWGNVGGVVQRLLRWDCGVVGKLCGASYGGIVRGVCCLCGHSRGGSYGDVVRRSCCVSNSVLQNTTYSKVFNCDLKLSTVMAMGMLNDVVTPAYYIQSGVLK